MFIIHVRTKYIVENGLKARRGKYHVIVRSDVI